MKNIILIFGLAFFLLPCFGQSAEEEVIRLKQEGSVEVNDEQNPAAPEKKGELGLSVSSTYTWMQGYGSMMGFSLMPTYTLPLNEKWALHGGLIASTYYGLGDMPYGEGLYGSPSMSNLSVFGAASYKLTDRLILHGAGVKQLTTLPGSTISSWSGDRLSFGAIYHIGDNMSIGASVQFRNSPYQGGFQNSVVGYPHSPFGW